MYSPVCNHLETYLSLALAARRSLLDENPQGVVRLFNGFYEGQPDLVVDWYAGTLVLSANGKDIPSAQMLLDRVQAFYLPELDGVACVLHKLRRAPQQELRCGKVIFGAPAHEIREHGVRYALDLQLNQDTSFYPDTRLLRAWLLQHSRGKSLFNAFACTGSLGVAALAGGARRVVQVDLSSKFLSLARKSVALNDLDAPAPKSLLQAPATAPLLAPATTLPLPPATASPLPPRMALETGDFFSRAAFYKRAGELFDLALLDPPFFSTTVKGRVDQAGETARLVNKIRPLVAHGGRLVLVNNALYLSGEAYLASLQEMCGSGYLAIETLIPVPEDITGYPHTRRSAPPVDPAPFNHPTKIAVLRVTRKDGAVR